MTDASPLARAAGDPPDAEREAPRLAALHSLGLIDAPPLPGLDRLTRLASHVFGTPVSLATLVDEAHQHFASAHGVPRGGTKRHDAFCHHALALEQGNILLVPDTAQDPRFVANPAVTGPPGIRFYAGAPIIIDGQVVGTLCVLATEPRHDFSDEDAARLTDFAALASDLMTQARETRRRRRAQTQLVDERLRLDIALGAGGIAAWEYDPGAGSVIWHDQGYEMFGLTEDEARQSSAYIDLVHSDDRADMTAHLEAVMEGREAEYRRVFRLNHPSGGVRWYVGAGRLQETDHGVRLIGVNYEVTDERRLVEERELAARELRHRIKNLIAVVTSLATGTARRSTSVDTFMQVFRGRLMALARGQDALLARGRERAGLADTVWDALRPFQGEGDGLTVRIQTADVAAEHVQTLNLVLHELATNAVKHGALGHGGRVDVDGAVENGVLRLVWTETVKAGAPRATDLGDGSARGENGFGTLLIDRTVEAASGRLTRDWRAEGLCLTIAMPVAASAPQPA